MKHLVNTFAKYFNIYMVEAALDHPVNETKAY